MIYLQYCASFKYKLGQEITDYECRLTGEKCGMNMVFVNVFEELTNHLGTAIECIQRCSCEEGYQNKEGECIRKVFTKFTKI